MQQKQPGQKQLFQAALKYVSKSRTIEHAYNRLHAKYMREPESLEAIWYSTNHANVKQRRKMEIHLPYTIEVKKLDEEIYQVYQAWRLRSSEEIYQEICRRLPINNVSSTLSKMELISILANDVVSPDIKMKQINKRYPVANLAKEQKKCLTDQHLIALTASSTKNSKQKCEQ